MFISNFGKRQLHSYFATMLAFGPLIAFHMETANFLMDSAPVSIRDPNFGGSLYLNKVGGKVTKSKT